MHGFPDCLNIFIVPPVLFLITGVTLGFFSLIKAKRQFENILFALICFWYSLLMPVFISHHIFKGNIELIIKIERFIHVFYVYGPAILIIFVHSVVNKKNSVIEAGAFGFSFIISLFVYTDYYFYGMWEFRWGYIAKGGGVLQIFGLWAMAAIVYSLVLSIKKLRTEIDLHTRLKIKYIMFAILSIAILTLGNLPALNGIDLYPPGNFAFIPMLFMAWGIYRHDAIKIDLYTKRRIAGMIVRVLVISSLISATFVGAWALGDLSLNQIVSKIMPYGLPPLLSFLVTVFLSLFSIRLGENRKDSIIFSILMLIYALLSIDILINSIIVEPDTGLRVSRFSHLFVVFLPALAMHLMRVVTGRNSERVILYINYLAGFVLLLFTQSEYYLQGMFTYSWGLFAKKAVLFDVMSTASALTLIYNIFILSIAYQQSENKIYRHRYLFLLIGTVSISVMSLADIPAMNGFDLYPIGNFIFIPSIFFAVALFRYNLPGLIRLAGTFLYSGLIGTAFLTAVYVMTEHHSDSYFPLYVIFSFVSIFLFEYLLRKLRDILLVTHQKKLKIAFENLNDKLSRSRSIDEISSCILNSSFNDVMCGCCAVLIYQENSFQYKGSKLWNNNCKFNQPGPAGETSLTLAIDESHPLLSYIKTKHSPVKQEEIEYWIFNNELNVELDDPLRKSEIVLPVFFENRLTAIILFGFKYDSSHYSGNEIGFLYQLGINLGPHIENAWILQRLEQTVEERTQKLRNSEEKYWYLIENAADGIFRNDINGNFLYINPVGLNLIGYSPDEVLKLNYRSLIPDEYRETVLDYFRKQLHDGAKEFYIEFPVIRKDGSYVWLGQNTRLEKGNNGVVEFYGISRDVTERRQIEESLRQSEEKYRTLLQTNNVGFFETDIKGKILACNDIVLSFTGYDRDELIGRNSSEFMTPETARKIDLAYNQVLDGKKTLGSIEHDIVRKDGTTAFLETTFSVVTDASGAVTGFRIIAIDVTRRKLIESALLESESKYRHFIENANEIIYKADIHGNFIYSNPAFQRILGYSDEEIKNLNYLDLIPAGNREAESDFYRSQLKMRVDETHRELPTLTKSGRIIWIEQDVRSVKDENGRIIEFDSIVHDITERKAAEDALRESENHYRLLMENVSDSVFICGSDGHFKYINPSITRLLGIPQSDVIGKHFLSIVHPDYRQQQLEFYTKQIKENIETTYSEFPVILKKDEIVWVGQTVRMIRNSNGMVEFYGISRDISSYKKSEEARRDLELAKTRFFSNISHEIRTPLTLMLGPIESVLQGNYGSEVDAEFFKNLHQNTLSLLKLVNNLLDFSKIEAGKMTLSVQEGDIVYFARHYLAAIKLAAKSKNINLELTAEPDSIILYFDPEKLDKVFMNLLSNALKFTGSGGTISINIFESDGNCYIAVSDTGEGIPKTSLNTIFDRFSQSDSTSTRKYEGTGIGLALVKELVELHGGSISVLSRYNGEYPDKHGSCFTLILPGGVAHYKNKPNIRFVETNNLDSFVKDYRQIGLRENYTQASIAPPGAESGESEVTLPAGAKTIMVVDDNDGMRNFLKILLQKQYRVIFAENGEDGIIRARDKKPDLIITDVMMPVMNGLEMTAIIKKDEKMKTTPVIMLTADTELINKVSGLENGADDYLHKPFNSIELITRISSLLKNYEYQQIISRRNADIESEMEVARLLQNRLLPPSMPEISGYHEHAVYIPMDKIGGDFYDIENREGFLNLFIADVSGHGLPGAFLATITKMALENITNRTSSNKVLYLLNNVILRHTVQSNFVTAFFAAIDISSNLMRYSCAGHIPPVVYRKKNDELFELKTKGMPLGWYNDIRIEEKTFQLESGDRVVFYTDGITECVNHTKEMFEEERFYKMIRMFSDKSAREFSEALMKNMEEFKGDNIFDDDITMVVIDVL